MVTDEPTYGKIKNPRLPGGKAYIPFLGRHRLHGSYRTATEAKQRAELVFSRWLRLCKAAPLNGVNNAGQG